MRPTVAPIRLLHTQRFITLIITTVLVLLLIIVSFTAHQRIKLENATALDKTSGQFTDYFNAVSKFWNDKAQEELSQEKLNEAEKLKADANLMEETVVDDVKDKMAEADQLKKSAEDSQIKESN